MSLTLIYNVAKPEGDAGGLLGLQGGPNDFCELKKCMSIIFNSFLFNRIILVFKLCKSHSTALVSLLHFRNT